MKRELRSSWQQGKPYEWFDQTEIEGTNLRPYSARVHNKRNLYSPCLFPRPPRRGSDTDWKVSLTSTPKFSRQRTWTPIPCQLASNNRWGLSKLAMPEKDLHGRSFRKGVRFSVQTFSDGNDACRIWCGASHCGSDPSGRKDCVGEVVRNSSIEPREAQKRPARAFLRPFQRSLTLYVCNDWAKQSPLGTGGGRTYDLDDPSPIQAQSSAPVATPFSSG